MFLVLGRCFCPDWRRISRSACRNRVVESSTHAGGIVESGRAIKRRCDSRVEVYIVDIGSRRGIEDTRVEIVRKDQDVLAMDG